MKSRLKSRLIMTVACAALVAAAPAPRDGSRDFDWEIGAWSTSVSVRRNPLTGEEPKWVGYRGTSVIKVLAAGRANAVELDISGATGRIEGLSLRLYNPQTRQWSLNFASFRNGMLTAPVFGGFDAGGRGTFYGQDMLDGKAILVRFIITRPTAKEARFDQAYSVDGGVTWEDNWHGVDVRQ